MADGGRLVSIGGDHTIALPLLRAVTEHHGPVALLHFDAHPDTLNTQHGGQYTHGTPFRRAVEEGLLLDDQSMHVGIRGSVFARSDLDEDADMGFRIVSSMDVAHDGVEATVHQIRDRVGNAPLYISIDIDVLDPAHAPGTGTPEAGGLTSRELLGILRGMVGLRIASADVVEVAPAYDHAEITTIAAAHVIYELVTLMGLEDVQGGTARGG